MATVVQTNSGSAVEVTSHSVAFSSDVTSGNLAVVMLGAMHFTDRTWLATDLTKTAGTATIGTPTIDVLTAAGGSNRRTAIWSVPITGTGSLTLTLTDSATDTTFRMYIAEVSGLDTGASRVADFTSVADISTGFAANSGDIDSIDGGVFFSVVEYYGGGLSGIDSAWTQIAAIDGGYAGGAAGYRVVATTTTDSAQWSSPTGDSWSIAAVVYKEGGATSIVPQAMASYKMRSA